MIKQFNYPEYTNPELARLYHLLVRIIGDELVNMNKGCYYPKMVRHWNDLLSLSKVNDSDILAFTSMISPQYRKISYFGDKYTMFIVMSMIYHARKNNRKMYNAYFDILSIKMYSNLMHKHWPKFCREDLWNSSLKDLSQRHLYKSQNGISNSVKYLSDLEAVKYYKLLSKSEIGDYDILKIVNSIRTRISQSIKSFATLYFEKFESKEGGIKGLSGTEEISNINLVAEKISMIMCTYNQVDKGALDFAIKKTNIRKELAMSAIVGISVPEFKNEIKFLIILLGRVADIRDICAEPKRLKVIRKIESKPNVGNYNVKTEMLNLLYGTDIGFQLRKVNRDQLFMFFIHYLTLFLKYRTCS